MGGVMIGKSKAKNATPGAFGSFGITGSPALHLCIFDANLSSQNFVSVSTGITIQTGRETIWAKGCLLFATSFFEQVFLLVQQPKSEILSATF